MSATFTRAAFETALDDLGERLGDLWAVDEVLTRARRMSVPSAGVSVRVGWTHPFNTMVFVEVEPSPDPLGPLPLVDSDAVQREVDQLGHVGAAWGRSVVAAVRHAVDPLVRPVPSAFAEAVDAVRSDLLGPLSTEVADDFAHLSSLSDWSGAAALQFADYCYGQVEHCVRNQAYAAEAVCFGLAGSKAVVQLGQHSLMGLVLAARDAVDEQLRQRAAAHGSSGSAGFDWLVLAATCAALVGAIPTGGSSLAALGVAAADATGVLLSYAASQVEDGEDVTFRATSAGEAADGLFDGLTVVVGRVDGHWTDLAEQMGRLLAAVRAAAEEHRLAPRRPRLMLDGRVTPAEWHHRSAPR